MRKGVEYQTHGRRDSKQERKEEEDERRKRWEMKEFSGTAGEGGNGLTLESSLVLI